MHHLFSIISEPPPSSAPSLPAHSADRWDKVCRVAKRRQRRGQPRQRGGGEEHTCWGGAGRRTEGQEGQTGTLPLGLPQPRVLKRRGGSGAEATMGRLQGRGTDEGQRGTVGILSFYKLFQPHSPRLFSLVLSSWGRRLTSSCPHLPGDTATATSGSQGTSRPGARCGF